MVQGPGFTEASVLDFVNELHRKNPAKATFSLAEIAEAMDPVEVAAVKAGAVDMLSWVESLNNVLKALGINDKLNVKTATDNNSVECAVVHFPTQ